MKTKVTLYHHINQKTAKRSALLSDEEALIRALDLMDFYAVLTSQNNDLRMVSEDIYWIELKYLLNDKQ